MSIKTRLNKVEKSVAPDGPTILPPIIIFGSDNDGKAEEEIRRAEQYMKEHPGCSLPPIIIR